MTSALKLQEEITKQMDLHEIYGRGPGKTTMLDLLSTYGVLGFGNLVHVLLQQGIFKEDIFMAQGGIKDKESLQRRFSLPCNLNILETRIMEVGEGESRKEVYEVDLGQIWGGNVVVRVEARGQRLISQNALVMPGDGLEDSAYESPEKRPRLETPDDGFHYPVHQFMHDGGIEGLMERMAERGLVVVQERNLVTRSDLLDMEDRIETSMEELMKRWEDKDKNRY